MKVEVGSSLVGCAAEELRADKRRVFSVVAHAGRANRTEIFRGRKKPRPPHVVVTDVHATAIVEMDRLSPRSKLPGPATLTTERANEFPARVPHRDFRSV